MKGGTKIDQQKFNFSPTEIHCEICGELIGEKIYIHKKNNDILGCDTCCDFDMEKQGCPLIFVKAALEIALSIDVRVKDYWCVLEEYIENKTAYFEIQGRSIWTQVG